MAIQKPENPKFVEPKDEPTVVETPKAEDVKREGATVAPTETSKPEQPKVAEVEDDRPQSYVWLANGAVKRCFDEDLPARNGADFGHWNEGDKVHTVVAIYPVEITVGK